MWQSVSLLTRRNDIVQTCYGIRNSNRQKAIDSLSGDFSFGKLVSSDHITITLLRRIDRLVRRTIDMLGTALWVVVIEYGSYLPMVGIGLMNTFVTGQGTLPTCFT